MFNMSVAPSQVRQEIFIPLTSCNRCYAVEEHQTNDCTLPATAKRCSECASEEHTFRECAATEKKCLNCGGPHSARAMRCPKRKEALRKKEDQIRKGKTQPTVSYATAAQPTLLQEPLGHALSGLICVLHAHMVNSYRPGTFQDTPEVCAVEPAPAGPVGVCYAGRLWAYNAKKMWARGGFGLASEISCGRGAVVVVLVTVVGRGGAGVD